MGKPLKIAVYTVALNEAKHVERWAASAKEADLMLIADTGSEDNTVELGRKVGVQVHEICISPWRFDYARNVALALIPKDYDICISMDMDEVLNEGWRAEVERAWTEGITRIRHGFSFNVGLYYFNTRIHARHGYYWDFMCHEIVCPQVDTKEVIAFNDKITMSHRPDPTKSRGGYIELLERAARADQDCFRMAYYYARELFYHSKWEESIKEFKRYLAMPSAVWDQERGFACRMIAQAYASLKDYANAEKYLFQATQETPNNREPWYSLAELMYLQQKWPESLAYGLKALSQKNKALVYTDDPAAWGEKPHDWVAIAAWNMGLNDLAIKHGQEALDINPKDERLKNNMQFYKKEAT